MQLNAVVLEINCIAARPDSCFLCLKREDAFSCFRIQQHALLVQIRGPDALKPSMNAVVFPDFAKCASESRSAVFSTGFGTARVATGHQRLSS